MVACMGLKIISRHAAHSLILEFPFSCQGKWRYNWTWLPPRLQHEVGHVRAEDRDNCSAQQSETIENQLFNDVTPPDDLGIVEKNRISKRPRSVRVWCSVWVLYGLCSKTSASRAVCGRLRDMSFWGDDCSLMISCFRRRRAFVVPVCFPQPALWARKFV